MLMHGRGAVRVCGECARSAQQQRPTSVVEASEGQLIGRVHANPESARVERRLMEVASESPL